jgi:hypothetical protein
MFGSLIKEKEHVLCVGDSDALFANVTQGKKRSKKVDVFSWVEISEEHSFDVAALVAGSGRNKAKVALVLPLVEFELVSVTVPPVAPGPLQKLLPYRLAKVLDRPVTDYIYDYQIAQKFKDRYELTVYLYPVAKFEQYRHSLSARHKRIVWFEPDVFAACAYLYYTGKVTEENTVLCLLAWEQSVSIALFENKRIALVRTVKLKMPKGKPGLVPESLTADDLMSDDELTGVERVQTVKKSELHEAVTTDSDVSDILLGFGLQEAGVSEEEKNGDSAKEVFRLEEIVAEEEVDPWKDYIETLNLEILRTGDYYTSVLKGKPIGKLFIGGGNHFFEVMSTTVRKEQGLQVERFPPDDIEAKCSQKLAAICVGALQR